jgi:hypothetical protein
LKTAARLILVICCANVAAAASPKQSSAKKEDDLIIHEPSRVLLPSRIGLFQRSDFKPFDKAGRDVGAGYDVDHLIRGDVYIYPVGAPGYGHDLPGEFQVQNKAIHELSLNVKLISRENLQINQGGHQVAGVHGTYDLQRELFGQRNVKCGSQLYIFRDGPWFIAYRFSYPREKSSIAVKHIATFLASWQWRKIPNHIP